MSAKSHQRGLPASIATGSNKRARENRRPVIALPRPPRLAGDWRDSHGSPSVVAHPCPVQHQISDLGFAGQHALDPGLSPCGASVSVDGQGPIEALDPTSTTRYFRVWKASIGSHRFRQDASQPSFPISSLSLCCNAHTQTREERVIMAEHRRAGAEERLHPETRPNCLPV
jgi:hypothetical protein